MIRIAVCDDDPATAKEISQRVDRAVRACRARPEIALYTKSTNLLADMADDGFRYDMLFLDIEMPELTGMELARAVEGLEPRPRVVLITDHMEYVLDAFALHVFRYVPKSDDTGRLEEAVREAVREIGREAHEYVTLGQGCQRARIPTSEIQYITRETNGCRFVTIGGEYYVRRSLKLVRSELDAEAFVEISRGCLVNLQHVAAMDRENVKMQGGEALYVTRPRRSEVRAAMCRYWGAEDPDEL